MTDRERWTVYPLLFLTLGIAVKDKIVRLTDADTVNCKQLIIHDRQNRAQVVISSTPEGGMLTDAGTIACKRLVVQDQQGRSQVVLAATPSGGLVRTSGLGNGFDVLLGHTDRIGGLMFVDPAGVLHNLNPSIIVAKPMTKPAQEPAPETKAAEPDSSPPAETADPQ
jgi:hypothetical protein